MSYIASYAERWYVARESAYGQIPAIDATNRIPAVSLKTDQERENSERKDKTGTRTWQGRSAGARLQTTFDMVSYMRDWPDPSTLPAQGPLFEAALGQAGNLWSGNAVADGSTALNIAFATPHGLAPGQAITIGGEIRFVQAIVDPQTIIVNAPFSSAPTSGAPIGQTATYGLATQLPSISIFDYWDPSTAVQRVLIGAGVDKLSVKLNADFHQFEFSGMAQDIVDSVSFIAGQGGSPAFPAEPALSPFSYSPVPGNLGEVWLGVAPSEFFTVSAATIEIQNDLDKRGKEFGSSLPRAIVPGMRTVNVSLELFAQDDNATTSLYQAARQELPIAMMFQAGQASGQLMGMYLKSVVPALPQWDDSDKRLKWKFTHTRAQGTADDEIVVAFG